MSLPGFRKMGRRMPLDARISLAYRLFEIHSSKNHAYFKQVYMSQLTVSIKGKITDLYYLSFLILPLYKGMRTN